MRSSCTTFFTYQLLIWKTSSVFKQKPKEVCSENYICLHHIKQIFPEQFCSQQWNTRQTPSAFCRMFTLFPATLAHTYFHINPIYSVCGYGFSSIFLNIWKKKITAIAERAGYASFLESNNYKLTIFLYSGFEINN